MPSAQFRKQMSLLCKDMSRLESVVVCFSSLINILYTVYIFSFHFRHVINNKNAARLYRSVTVYFLSLINILYRFSYRALGSCFRLRLIKPKLLI